MTTLTEARSEAIRHRVGIAAPVGEVYRALATVQGLTGWWAPEVRGECAVGGKLAFHFGNEDYAALMEIAALDPGRRVVWRCVGGAAEWIGTEITFGLTAGEQETVLLFTHTGWREPDEFMAHCSTKWSVFLLGLKAGLEGGSATPFPGEVKLGSWG